MLKQRVFLDLQTFDPWKVQPVTHDLCEHPLFQLAELKLLGQRLEAADQVRSHSSLAKADTSFEKAPELHPTRKKANEMLADVEKAEAWMSLLNVQTDRVYRTLVDEVLDGVKSLIESKDPGMCYRGGWIFVSSPNAVTPYHMDMEHNFILQIRGKKRVYVWDPLDRSVVSERGQELFLTRHSRELVKFSEELRAKAMVFDLEPGQGAYMPSTSPHMVENGDNASVTMSFTYYTAATRRKNLVYRGKSHLRRLGIDTRPFGQSKAQDELLYLMMTGYTETKDLALKLLGKSPQPMSAPYAFHLSA